MVEIFSILQLVLLGITSGVVSTTIMSIFEIIPWKRWGIEGVYEWHENQVLVKRYFKNMFSRANKLNFGGIFFLHYINGILASITYVFIIWYFIEEKIIEHSIHNFFITGTVYAIFLWVVTLFPIHKPITGLNPLRHPLGYGPVFCSLAGHFIYAIVLSFWIWSFI